MDAPRLGMQSQEWLGGEVLEWAPFRDVHLFHVEPRYGLFLQRFPQEDGDVIAEGDVVAWRARH
jgi:hypothetical protein